MLDSRVGDSLSGRCVAPKPSLCTYSSSHGAADIRNDQRVAEEAAIRCPRLFFGWLHTKFLTTRPLRRVGRSGAESVLQFPCGIPEDERLAAEHFFVGNIKPVGHACQAVQQPALPSGHDDE